MRHKIKSSSLDSFGRKQKFPGLDLDKRFSKERYNSTEWQTIKPIYTLFICSLHLIISSSRVIIEMFCCLPTLYNYTIL